MKGDTVSDGALPADSSVVRVFALAIVRIKKYATIRNKSNKNQNPGLKTKAGNN